MTLQGQYLKFRSVVFLLLVVLGLSVSCNTGNSNNNILHFEVGYVEGKYTDSINAVVVNKFYNFPTKEYSIFYRNINNEIFQIKGDLTSNIKINDSIVVVFEVDSVNANHLFFKDVYKIGVSDDLELINITYGKDNIF